MACKHSSKSYTILVSKQKEEKLFQKDTNNFPKYGKCKTQKNTYPRSLVKTYSSHEAYFLWEFSEGYIPSSRYLIWSDKSGMFTREKNSSFCSSRELLVMKKFFQHKEWHQIAEHGLGTLVRKLLPGTTESGCTVESSQKLGELTCRQIHHPYNSVSRTWCGSSHPQHKLFNLRFFWHQCKLEFGLQLDLTGIEFPRLGFKLSMVWGKGVTCEIFRSKQTVSIKRTARLKSWLGELEQPCWDSAFGLSETPKMSYINLHCLVSGFRHDSVPFLHSCHANPGSSVTVHCYRSHEVSSEQKKVPYISKHAFSSPFSNSSGHQRHDRLPTKLKRQPHRWQIFLITNVITHHVSWKRKRATGRQFGPGV